MNHLLQPGQIINQIYTFQQDMSNSGQIRTVFPFYQSFPGNFNQTRIQGVNKQKSRVTSETKINTYSAKKATNKDKQQSLHEFDETNSPRDPGLKERNRVAARKWRSKQNKHLNELENENDELRKNVFDLHCHYLKLQTENKLLDEEISAFQKLLTELVRGPEHSTETNSAN